MSFDRAAWIVFGDFGGVFTQVSSGIYVGFCKPMFLFNMTSEFDTLYDFF